MADTIQILTTSTFSNSATLQSDKVKGDIGDPTTTEKERTYPIFDYI